MTNKQSDLNSPADFSGDVRSRLLHILLLNQYFPPDTSATAKVARQIVEALGEQHQVTVLAGRPSYNPTEMHPYYMWRRQVAGQITVERVGSTGYYRGRMRQRVLNYSTYLALALPRALAIKADIVISMTDPPLAGLIGALAARLKKRPFVYYIQDLHPDMAVISGMVQPAGWVTVWERLHRWILRQATHIVVLGTDMRALVIAKGIPPERLHIVRSGAPIPATLPEPTHPTIQEIRAGYDFVAIHAGNLGFYGAWETLVQAAKLLNDDNIGLLFIGEGAAKPKLEQLASGSRNIRFLPFRPVDDVPYVLASADMHIVTIKRGAEGVIVPSKLYPILAAGRPILAVVPESSDVAQIVTENSCGLVATPDDPTLVAETIRRICQNPEQLTAMSQNARKAALIYDVNRQLQQLVELIEKTASGTQMD